MGVLQNADGNNIQKQVKILQIFETGNMLLALPVEIFRGSKSVPSDGAFTAFPPGVSPVKETLVDNAKAGNLPYGKALSPVTPVKDAAVKNSKKEEKNSLNNEKPPQVPLFFNGIYYDQMMQNMSKYITEYVSKHVSKHVTKSEFYERHSLSDKF